jgi:pimeloyl-ACP methyl ester carboxylesterase
MCGMCSWHPAWLARLSAHAEIAREMRRIPIRVDTDVCGAPGWICGDIFLPDELAPIRQVVLFCFPGGGVTRGYFNIPGATSFSFVRAMTARGFVCATFDHPGTGESSVPGDGFALDGAAIAAAGAEAVRYVAKGLRLGRVSASVPPMERCVCIGIGHSMGAMIVTLQQNGELLYDAAALLCFTTRGLPEVLTEEEFEVAAMKEHTAADYARLAQARFGVPFPSIAPARGDSAAAQGLAAVAGALAATSAIQSMLPGNVAREAASLKTKLFLAAGDRDLTGPPHAIPAAFSGCNDLRLVVVPGAGHHPFVTEGAPRLYACMAEWIDTIQVAA